MPYKNIEDKNKNAREYYWKNRGEKIEYAKRYQKEHPEIHKAWLLAHPEKVKEYREKRKPKQREWRRAHKTEENERNRKNHIKKKLFVDNYKLSHGCAHCGYNKCAEALHFHHGEEKEFNIGKAVSSNMSDERLLMEMERCIVLCANCHIEEHVRMRKG